MSGTDDLAVFVTARLDDDERYATAALGLLGIETEWHTVQQLRERGLTRGDAMFVSRQSSRRALREVEAKRAILAEHRQQAHPEYGHDVPRCGVCLSGRGGWQEDWHADPWPCRTLRHLAAAWSDDPRYRQVWEV